MSSSTQRWPTWVIVVAVLILAIPVVWFTIILVNLVSAMSLAGIIIIALLIFLFIRLRKRVNAEEEYEERHGGKPRQ